jgi:hypothetical protein
MMNEFSLLKKHVECMYMKEKKQGNRLEHNYVKTLQKIDMTCNAGWRRNKMCSVIREEKLVYYCTLVYEYLPP